MLPGLLTLPRGGTSREGPGWQLRVHRSILTLLTQHHRNPSQSQVPAGSSESSPLYLLFTQLCAQYLFAYHGPCPRISMTAHLTKGVSEKCHLALPQRNIVPFHQPRLSQPIAGPTQRKA